MIRTRENRFRFLGGASSAAVAGAVVVSLWTPPGSAGALHAQSLGGSQASLDRQNAQARAHDYTFLRTPSHARTFVEQGYIVPVVPSSDFELVQVSFPYARTEVRLFVERLSSQYRAACGKRMVVTSLTRPLSAQPRNASDRSVHPTGMAVDLRRSTIPRCRSWIERVLLQLEAQGVLEATHERSPPHYHVAVYPQPYARYVAARVGAEQVGVLAARGPATSLPEVGIFTHVVSWGETLSEIALHYGTSVARLRVANDMSSDFLRAGRELEIPAANVAPPAARMAGSGGANPPARTMALASVAPAPSSPVADSRPTPSASTPPPLDGPATHRVRSGESLWTIARLYGVAEDLLRAANGIRGSRILAGQTLLVPLSALGSGMLRYTVRSGDSLWVIANRLGTTVDRIREENRMDTTRIYAGQVLDVPLSR